MTYILVFSLCGLAIGWLRPRRGFTIVVLATSLLSIFWLQPLSPIRNLDFWLPLTSITLTCLVWAITFSGEQRSRQPYLPGILVIIGVVLGVALLRYSGPICCLTQARPPQIQFVLMALAFIFFLVSAVYFLMPAKPALLSLTLAFLVGLFIFLKSEPLAEYISSGLRSISGQSTELASSTDLAWLGFSFLAFRLLHAIRDSQSGRMPPYSLGEFAAYALFFPAVISGPIDRAQHFMSELEKARAAQDDPDWKVKAQNNTIKGTHRVLIGAFKKIVLADSLALFALNVQNAEQITSTSWMWVLVLAFALRIYLDFSGYTDIALGVALYMGISLPENFDNPYAKQNITAFWNSWHITLAQWFRSYVFNPFTRSLRTNYKYFPAWFIILSGQVLTMSLIGIWHGITWNFLIWGLWHGFGLFLQNRWSEWMRTRLRMEEFTPFTRWILKFSGWALTFLFVCLGWVWFATPSPTVALDVFSKLFGLFG